MVGARQQLRVELHCPNDLVAVSESLDIRIRDGDARLLFEETVGPLQHRRPDPIVGVQGQNVRTQGSFDPCVSGTR